MKRTIYFLVLSCLVLLLTGCAGSSKADKEEKTPLMISAAASLTDVLNELKPIFEE